MIRYRCDAPGCKKYIKKSDKKCPHCGSAKRVYYVVLGNMSVFAGDKLKNAEDMERELKREKRHRNIEEYQTPEVIPFEVFVDEYYRPYFINKNRTTPREAHLKYFKELFAGRDIKAIRQADVLKAMHGLADKYAPATRNRYLATIKGIFTCAVKLDKVNKHPARISGLVEDNERLRYLTYEEENLLLPECKKLGILNVVMVALYTGMRRGELISLAPDDIRDGMVYVKGENTKTAKTRIIPIHDKIKEYLMENFAFRYDFDRHFSDLAAKAGLDGVTFHTLRHTFASRLVMQGVDLLTVSKLMGHKSIKTTQRYSHLAPKIFNDAINRL